MSEKHIPVLHIMKLVPMGDGLIGGVISEWGKTHKGLIALAKVRKPTTCAITGEPINVGDEAWRMLTNGSIRMYRISVDGMNAELKRFSPPP